MISQPVSSNFPCFPLASGTWRTPGLSIPWCCPPTSYSVGLVFFPLSQCLARWFGQTWWTGDIIIPLQFVSVYDGWEVFVWSDYYQYRPYYYCGHCRSRSKISKSSKYPILSQLWIVTTSFNQCFSRNCDYNVIQNQCVSCRPNCNYDTAQNPCFSRTWN